MEEAHINAADAFCITPEFVSGKDKREVLLIHYFPFLPHFS